MTMPSLILPAIAQSLANGLVDGSSHPLVQEVRVWDGEFGPTGDDFVSIRDPGVLVACVQAEMVADGSVPKLADAFFVVYVITKTNAPDKRTRGVRGADLAMLIGAIVDGNAWNGNAARIPYDVALLNEHTEKLAKKGVSVWSVSWVQRVEIDSVVPSGAYPLNHIVFTFEQGGSATPKEQAQVDLPGATP